MCYRTTCKMSNEQASSIEQGRPKDHYLASSSNCTLHWRTPTTRHFQYAVFHNSDWRYRVVEAGSINEELLAEMDYPQLVSIASYFLRYRKNIACEDASCRVRSVHAIINNGKEQMMPTQNQSTYNHVMRDRPECSEISGIKNTKLSKHHEPIWETRFQELLEYKNKHGHCNVPYRRRPLGLWVHKQRMFRKKKKIANERIERLDRLGFWWGRDKSVVVAELVGPDTNISTFDELWEVRFRQLVDYKKECGNCKVPLKYEKNAALGLWVDRQRATNRKKKLSKERYERLSQIGFFWGRGKLKIFSVTNSGQK